MKRFVKSILSIGKVWDKIYNKVILYYKKIQYASYPAIEGKLHVINNGTIKFGKDVRFCSTTQSNYVGLFKPCSIAVMNGALLEIGHHSGFSGVSIYCAEKIQIGNYVNIGGNVCIWDTDFHPLDYQQRRADNMNAISTKPIFIGDDVFVGANSIILKGVTIGEKSIIGAGSVVTKSIPAGEIWAGNPARFIRKINVESNVTHFNIQHQLAI